MRKQGLVWVMALAATVQVLAAAPAAAQQKKPNILVMFGDDVGYWNVSAYNRGMMGYRTPNIARGYRKAAAITSSDCRCGSNALQNADRRLV